MKIVLLIVLILIVTCLSAYAYTMATISDDYILKLLWNYKQEVSSLKRLQMADDSELDFITSHASRIQSELKQVRRFLKFQYPIGFNYLKWACNDILSETTSFLASLNYQE